MESATPEPNLPAQTETLSSMCSWWATTKQEKLPGICHWFVHPHKKVININQPGSFFDNMGMTTMGHAHSSTSLSLVLILGGVFLILFITAIITCIKRQKETQSVNEEVLRNVRISNHIRRINSSNMVSVLEGSKDCPPDYATAVKTKEEEEKELPSYSQAMPEGDQEIKSHIEHTM